MSNNAPLVAILFADLENYSLLMNRDEGATIEFLERCLARARRASVRFGGQVFKTTGDGWISFFPSASGAVDCARTFQRLVARREPVASPQFRIAVHLGEVRFEGGDAYGHAINVAARMQVLAKPGGIVISQPVMAQIRAGARCHFEALGRPHLKNIGDDLAIYRLVEGSTAKMAAHKLRLNILGGVRVTTSTGESVAIGSTHMTALLGALALQQDEPLAPDRLLVMLWPGRPAKQAREALARTRRKLNDRLASGSAAAIILDQGTLRLDLAAIEVDLHRIHRSAETGDIDPALRLGDEAIDGLLAGFEDISPLFLTWLMVRRAIWRDRLVSALELCLEREDAGPMRLRLAAEALLRFEPGHEPAALALMRHFAERGWAEAALREFDRLSDHLRDAYVSAPGAAVTAMAASLRRGGDCAPVRLRLPRALRLPQIAIGVFTADDPAARSVADQFRSELLANLSRFRTWAVLDVAEGDYGAPDYALTGRCDILPEGARLNLRLIEPGSRRLAWSETVSVSAAEWRAAHILVDGRAAATLEVYVSADRLARGIGASPGAPVDYDIWLSGEALLLRWTPAAEDEARLSLESLIVRAPDFAPAYASLASIHNVRHILHPGSQRTKADDDAAHANAARAVELDPLDARNHLALAWSAALTNRFDNAAVHLDLATSLNPYSPNTTISAAMGYAFLGDHAKAAETLDESIALAPILRSHHWCYAASVRFLGGNDTTAVAAALRSGDQIADNQGWLAAALARQGRIAEARQAFGRFVDALAPFWVGKEPINPESVHAWFVGAYPIREDADRASLSDALRCAMPAPVVSLASRSARD